MNSTKIEPKYISKSNPRVGLIALASDFMIEKDFINIIKDKEIDFFVNRIECYNPLTKENLIKSSFPSSFPLCASPLVQAKIEAIGLVDVSFPC